MPAASARSRRSNSASSPMLVSLEEGVLLLLLLLLLDVPPGTNDGDGTIPNANVVGGAPAALEEGTAARQNRDAGRLHIFDRIIEFYV
jgi:hypothetical protein